MTTSFPYLGNPNYQEYTDLATRLAGADPGVPGQLATTLKNSVSTLEDLAGPVKSALSDLAADWTGPAATKFQSYGGQLGPATDALKQAFDDAATVLTGVSRAMDYSKQATTNLQGEIEGIYNEISALSDQVDSSTIDDSVSQLYRNATTMAQQIQTGVSGLLSGATDSINKILAALDTAFGALKASGGDDVTPTDPDHPTLRQPDDPGGSDSDSGSGDGDDPGSGDGSGTSKDSGDSGKDKDSDTDGSGSGSGVPDKGREAQGSGGPGTDGLGSAGDSGSGTSASDTGGADTSGSGTGTSPEPGGDTPSSGGSSGAPASGGPVPTSGGGPSSSTGSPTAGGASGAPATGSAPTGAGPGQDACHDGPPGSGGGSPSTQDGSGTTSGQSSSHHPATTADPQGKDAWTSKQAEQFPPTYSGHQPAYPAHEAAPPTGSVDDWMTSALDVLRHHGIPVDHIDRADLATLIHTESGDNPGTIGSHAPGAAPAGLMQTLPQTFDRYHLPGYDNILDPVDNIVAGVRYALATYGSLASTPPLLAAHPLTPGDV